MAIFHPKWCRRPGPRAGALAEEPDEAIALQGIEVLQVLYPGFVRDCQEEGRPFVGRHAGLNRVDASAAPRFVKPSGKRGRGRVVAVPARCEQTIRGVAAVNGELDELGRAGSRGVPGLRPGLPRAVAVGLVAVVDGVPDRRGLWEEQRHGCRPGPSVSGKRPAGRQQGRCATDRVPHHGSGGRDRETSRWADLHSCKEERERAEAQNQPCVRLEVPGDQHDY